MVILQDGYELKAGANRYVSHNEVEAIQNKMRDVTWWDDLVTIGTVFKIDKTCEAATMCYRYAIDFLLPEGEEVMFALRHGPIHNLRIIPTHITFSEWRDQQSHRVSVR